MRYPISGTTIKHILLSLLSRCAPQRFFDLLEGLSAQVQGKGWGNDSIKEEVAACLSLLGKIPAVFVDIGANHGYYTNEFLQWYPKAECHLFEPSSTCVNRLHESFSSFENVFVIQSALSDHNTRCNLYSPAPSSAYASLSNRRMSHHGIDMQPIEEVSVLRFDSYWHDDRFIDYVKIDVEGHELSVLKGFGSKIAMVRLIQFEFGSAHVDTRTFFQDFWYFFSELNFDIFRITPSGPRKMRSYKDRDECFSSTNYVAVNRMI
jgi:FkbM family methyltransferase